MNKNCSRCVYNDGLRADNTWRCCTPERQHDEEITDCCVPVGPLREIQLYAVTAEQFITRTRKYINNAKSKSAYWAKQIKANGQ
jgi:hypothetical protein